MRLLVCLTGLLGLSEEAVEGELRLFIWPGAATVAWSELPAASKDDLRECIGAEALNWANLHSEYGGPRIAIDETGDWIYFVLGGD